MEAAGWERHRAWEILLLTAPAAPFYLVFLGWGRPEEVGGGRVCSVARSLVEAEETVNRVEDSHVM